MKNKDLLWVRRPLRWWGILIFLVILSFDSIFLSKYLKEMNRGICLLISTFVTFLTLFNLKNIGLVKTIDKKRAVYLNDLKNHFLIALFLFIIIGYGI